MEKKYYKAIIYYDNGEVIVEEYDGTDAVESLHHVCSFFDKNHNRSGEYCIAEAKEDAINELLKFFNGTIEEMQEILNRWKKNASNLREMLKPTK